MSNALDSTAKYLKDKIFELEQERDIINSKIIAYRDALAVLKEEQGVEASIEYEKQGREDE